MVIALDLGTSSVRATLYDRDGRAVPGRFHQVTYEPTLTHDGGAEHDPSVLLDAVATCLDAVTRASRHDDIQAVGVTTFWHGLLGFDAARRPVTPIFTWADSRSAPDAALLRGALDDATLHGRTGCHLHSSYWPAKLRWLARERPADVQRVASWGSIGEHLELALFGETATSVSMASGTGLLDQDDPAVGRRGAGRRRHRAGAPLPARPSRRTARAARAVERPLAVAARRPVVSRGRRRRREQHRLQLPHPVTDRAQRGDLGRACDW